MSEDANQDRQKRTIPSLDEIRNSKSLHEIARQIAVLVVRRHRAKMARTDASTDRNPRQ